MSSAVPDDLALRLGDLAGVGLLQVDADSVVRQANAAAHRMLGRPPGKLVERTVLEAFVDHRVAELLAEDSTDGGARRELTLPGEPPRTLYVHATPDSDPQMQWLVVQDLSELRRLQRIRTEFVDNLSHELRTPVTNMRLLVETLALEIETADVGSRLRESVSRIETETDRLAQMVTELLDLARIEQGDVALRHDRVDLAEVIGTVAARLKAFADRHEVSIVVELSPNSADQFVVGDRDRLEQMLINIVHNAIKFSPERVAAEVNISTAPDHEDDRMVVIKVEDSGPGIAKRDLKRIFERFYKVDRARTRSGASGTGLGLAIARHIAEAHGGRIWAESVEGDGAQFFVALPRA